MLTAEGITVVRHERDGGDVFTCQIAPDYVGLSFPCYGVRNVDVSISKDGLIFRTADYEVTHISKAAIKVVQGCFVLDFGDGDVLELPTRIIPSGSDSTGHVK